MTSKKELVGKLDISKRGTPMLTAPFQDPKGEIVQLSNFMGKPLLVNIWATWCVACRVEHPVLNRLAAEGVVIYGVNYKDTNADAIKWLKDFHNPYQLNISDADGRLGLDLGVYGAPETYLIDANGVIRHKFIGVIDDRVWDTDLGARYQALVEEAK